jgi:hypothetical protein
MNICIHKAIKLNILAGCSLNGLDMAYRLRLIRFLLAYKVTPVCIIITPVCIVVAPVCIVVAPVCIVVAPVCIVVAP